MRIMPLVQQNLNNRPCVKNNQPNFNGIFVRENPHELEKMFPRTFVGAEVLDKVTPNDSVGAKVLDILELIINSKATSPHLRVTVSPVTEKSAGGGVLFFDPEKLTLWEERNNLEINLADVRPENKASEETIGVYLDPEESVDTNISGIMSKLLDRFKGYFNWENIAQALRKN